VDKKLYFMDSEFNIEYVKGNVDTYMGITAIDSINWVAKRSSDEIYVTTNAGTTWEKFVLSNNETSLLEKSYNQHIKHIGGNDFVLFGSNRITLFNVGFANTSVQNTQSLYINSEYHFYPNPAKNYITIKLNCDLDIIDIIGRVVLSKTGTYSNQLIDISKLNNGLYFVKIKHNGEEKIEKLII